MHVSRCIALALAGAFACSPPPVDLEAARASLMEADRAFDRATAERGVDAWVSYFAEDGRQFLSGRPVVQGHAAIRELMTRGLAPGNSLRWEPEFAVVGASGDFGYTSGIGVGEFATPDGGVVRNRSRYVTVWRRDPDGSWKVVADIGVEAPAEEQDSSSH
jgi:ketosteroid isomerase-like protein